MIASAQKSPYYNETNVCEFSKPFIKMQCAIENYCHDTFVMKLIAEDAVS